MNTLRELYDQLGDMGDEEAYNAVRAKKVAGIARYIADHLRDPSLADALAEEIMSRAEQMGRIDSDNVSGEVPSRYTVSGNPLPFTL